MGFPVDMFTVLFAIPPHVGLAGPLGRAARRQGPEDLPPAPVVHRRRRARLRQARRPLTRSRPSVCGRPSAAARLLTADARYPSFAGAGRPRRGPRRPRPASPATSTARCSTARRSPTTSTRSAVTMRSPPSSARRSPTSSSAPDPNLVAIRPLVESVATRVAGGDLLSGPTRTAAAGRPPGAHRGRRRLDRPAPRRRRRRRHRRARRRSPPSAPRVDRTCR